jgi:Pyruvate/2-oxoacid:ferredoxin oxidoreductase delta subunit
LKFQQSFCVVDSDLRLFWVGGDWDDFALSNAGERALATNVLATSLSSHITDIRTADKVAEMIAVVIKLKRPLKLEYRCDSPDEVRRFRLTIQPLKDDRVVMVHDLRDAIKLENPMQVWMFDPNARREKCSMCGAVHMAPGWIDPLESQVPHPDRVRYTLCDGCEVRADAAINATILGDVPEDELELAIKAGIGLG